jgi:hypothetical protein
MSTSSKTKPIDTPDVEPTLADALAAMEAARVQDRELTAEESRRVAGVLSKADRPTAAAIHEAGRELDRASQARAARSAFEAADRARDKLNAFAAIRPVEFAKLPPFLQLAWVMCERAGGRSTAEGRGLARLLEDIAGGEAIPVPAAFMPAPKLPGQP